MHELTMNIYELTILTTTQTWGSHHLPHYIILYDPPRGLHPNGIFLWTPKLGVPQFSKLGLL
jgi:hypothetical protein